ncbi:MAG TPA: alpha/beta fold hydrolase [Burkholderiaceae bacterium]|nr:alpha/beta fold hydrolase [Burkholderiaceae bacterium]
MPEAIRPFRSALVLATTLTLIASGCASLDTLQREAIFQPPTAERIASNRWLNETPEAVEQYDLALANGDKIHTWYLPGDEPDAPTVLYLHGARWNLNGSAFRMNRWRELGFAVLAIDYRGFGKSTALLPSERTAAEDVDAAFAELARRQPDPTKRWVHGHSLGGALAVDLATREDRFAGLIVESSFTSIRDMLRETRWGWIPLLPLMLTQEFDSLSKMPRLSVPTMFVHGTEDRYVPAWMSERLYNAARATRDGVRRLVKIDGASHSNASVSGGQTYLTALREFITAASPSLPNAVSVAQ